MKCLECYVKCWKHRKEHTHDEDKQRKRVIEWHENVNNRIVNSEMTQLKCMLVDVKKLQQSATDKIRRWTSNVKEIKQEAENSKE